MAEKLVNKAGLEEFASKVKEEMVFIDSSSQSSIPQSITDIFYPVGSIYQTENTAFDPNTTWGGTWVKIEGKFLLGSSSSHVVGTTGGEETHKLTVNEMPSHGHQVWHLGTTSGGNDGWVGTGGSWSGRETGSKGGDQPHNNMPPYYTVNIWKRTA